MNPPEFVITLLVIVFAFSLLKRRMGHRNRWEQSGVEDSAETQRLRDEVKQLKDRIQVLERITVDKENSVARQIEELRDR